MVVCVCVRVYVCMCCVCAFACTRVFEYELAVSRQKKAHPAAAL